MIQAAKIACAGISATRFATCFVERLERRETDASFNLRVLTYHRIGYPDQEEHGDRQLISATPEAFRRQMELLSDHYQVVSMEEVLSAVRQQQRLPPRAVLITFDDAYPDFQEFAWPILREKQLPVILFVPTAYPDRPGVEFWWDRLARAIRHADPRETIAGPCGRFPLNSTRGRHRALRSLREYVKTLPHETAMQWVEDVCQQLKSPRRTVPATLGWSELRRLHDQGVVLGAHTRTHPLLNRVNEQQLEEEIRGSKADIEQRIGTCPPVFAYPAGAVGPRASAILHDAGFELAWTTRPGINDLRHDRPLELRRFHIGTATTPSLLRARLATARPASKPLRGSSRFA